MERPNTANICGALEQRNIGVLNLQIRLKEVAREIATLLSLL
jgi:hypothetical protein